MDWGGGNKAHTPAHTLTRPGTRWRRTGRPSWAGGGAEKRLSPARAEIASCASAAHCAFFPAHAGRRRPGAPTAAAWPCGSGKVQGISTKHAHAYQAQHVQLLVNPHTGQYTCSKCPVQAPISTGHVHPIQPPHKPRSSRSWTPTAAVYHLLPAGSNDTLGCHGARTSEASCPARTQAPDSWTAVFRGGGGCQLQEASYADPIRRQTGTLFPCLSHGRQGLCCPLGAQAASAVPRRASDASSEGPHAEEAGVSPVQTR